MTIKLIDENLVGQPGLSRYIDPKVGWESNPENFETCVYTDRLCFGEVDSSKSNYAWIIEPPIINGENYINIVKDHKKFKKVFSHHTNLANSIDNFVYVAHGGTWLRQEDIAIHPKSKIVSSIFSNKNWNAYHRMRQRIYDRLKETNVDFYGTGCDKPIEYKITGLKDYMFSIVVENSIENDYFTEKLIDCFLTGTIPVYCGTKNVCNYFDSSGIIFFEGDEDLPSIIEKLNKNLYNETLDAVVNNFNVAHRYIHPEHTINEHVK